MVSFFLSQKILSFINSWKQGWDYSTNGASADLYKGEQAYVRITFNNLSKGRFFAKLQIKKDIYAT